MAVKFTPDQQKAIDLHKRDILVSAAAGSGKTAVLSERIVKMVCDKEHPIDVDRLLVVTFTHAAAAEMRERISKKLEERLKEDSENEHLQRQVALLHNAQITTIDSFCQFILKNNFEDIGLDPVFRVIDEGEVKFIKKEVLEELLEEKFEEKREAFLKCVEFFCPDGKEAKLENCILDLHKYSLSFPFPEDWLKERKTDYAFTTVEELSHTPWMQFYFQHTKKMMNDIASDFTKARRICEEADGPYMYAQNLEDDEHIIAALNQIEDMTLFMERLQNVSFTALSRKKDVTVSEEKKEQVKKLRENAKKAIDKLGKGLFNVSTTTMLKEAAGCNEVLSELIDLCLAFSERVTEKKREKKVIDFSDMEHLALQILVKKDDEGNVIPTKTAMEYQDYFEEILIDEYQDSNLVQEYLLGAVARKKDGGRNRFMVGDVKQSIYKFRLARPDLFLQKYKSYAPDDEKECRIDLHQNFRSRKEVLECVNHIFEKIMTEDIGGIIYDDAAALHVGASYPENQGCESEFLLVEKPDSEEEEIAQEAEAKAIALKILALMENFQVTKREKNEVTGEETASLRPIEFKDIVILVRSQDKYDEAFKKVFDTYGIPIYVEGKKGYFSTKEIKDVLEYLRVLDNPYQDIPMFSVMKSVFGGFSDDEIAMIRAKGNKTKKLYENMKEAALLGDEKCNCLLEKINRYRDYSVYMTIREILETLFTEHDYLAYVSAKKAGAKRIANVQMLLTKAQAFEKNSYYGLFHFIRYIEQMEKFDIDSGEAVTLDENENVVRLMTIHKSKGLEFPVAIIAGMGKKFNNHDYSGSFIMDTDLGVGIHYVNVEKRYSRRTLRRDVLALKIRLDSLAEEMRVLYVAMTRAKEKLIMTAAVTDPVKTISERNPTVNYRTLAEADGYLKLLLPVFPNPQAVLRADLLEEEVETSADRILRKEALKHAKQFGDEDKFNELTEKLNFVYPFAYLKDVYTKTSVSELKMQAIAAKEEEQAKEAYPTEEIVPYIPKFMREEEKVLGASRGSAMHKIMELIDFTREYEKEADIKTAMEGFLQEGRLSKEYFDIIRVDKVYRFLKSDLGKRMAKAQREGKLFREQPFVLGIEQVETVLIQGIIDAYFEEDGQIVLMDYKTDIKNSGEELVEYYKTQIDYYEKALLALTEKPVKEKILYSFYFEKEVPVK